MRLSILFLFLCLIFTACSSDIDPSADEDYSNYFIFGTFFGECGGDNCVQTYKIEKGNLYKDIIHQYPGSGPYTFQIQSLEKYQTAKALLETFPMELLKEKESRIGNPDEHDQGGIFIAYKKNSFLKYWQIDRDRDKIPEYLRDYAKEVERIVDEFRG